MTESVGLKGAKTIGDKRVSSLLSFSWRNIVPQRPAEEPITKVTLNLFDRDIERMKHMYGNGWTTVIRALVRRHLIEMKAEVHEDE
jgi:hypothetical protein